MRERVTKAKIERGHATDRRDVDSMIAAGLIDRKQLKQLFSMVLPEMKRYPAIDPEDFRDKIESVLKRMPQQETGESVDRRD